VQLRGKPTGCRGAKPVRDERTRALGNGAGDLGARAIGKAIRGNFLDDVAQIGQVAAMHQFGSFRPSAQHDDGPTIAERLHGKRGVVERA